MSVGGLDKAILTFPQHSPFLPEIYLQNDIRFELIRVKTIEELLLKRKSAHPIFWSQIF